ncbi:hypothetical protein [Pseudoduganella violacea]|uniref:Uncharacterized protein n=1 Tax=Pseudoduganella violacea TaxID=1715466 RepID=A0A7W5FTD4_9BURK|nr:hypothetical protein [Pseudoduganella violacea]MBB3118073.1 hypothetical protein [Pseudoduganella violacea]
MAAPLPQTYLATGLVPRLPTAVLCTGIGLFSVLLCCGLIRDTVTKGRIEQKRFAYLVQPAPSILASFHETSDHETGQSFQR